MGGEREEQRTFEAKASESFLRVIFLSFTAVCCVLLLGIFGAAERSLSVAEFS
jgi:hypothetical protein